MRHRPLVLAILFASSAPAQPHRLVEDGDARRVDVWAPVGMMQSPVSICLDPAGNLYIAESDRAGNAVQDTRQFEHLNAVEEDLKFKSIDDRLAQIRRWIAQGAFPPDFFTRTEDRVRVLSDADGDGIADRSQVFAGGFNDELDGIGSGVLWRDGTLYYTCIPNLWVLPDEDGDLKADSRTSLASGFGIRWCFFGHDLHGLTNGPDGRIYFSMGDRGYNIATREGKRLIGVDRGGVFRCWPDGSGLELYYQGLRNPQELAFSELGDLFTGDNNCDSGDKARIVHIVEGGDSGWRQDVQSLESRGPWNRESIWKTLAEAAGPARPAWALPPVDYMCAGPSGLALYPGTGESRAYDGCFFLVDFYGSGSTVHAFRCVPTGAGFRVADHVEYYKGLTITDIAWGYDGRLFMSDWGGGWAPNPNGVILAVSNTDIHANPEEAKAIAEVRNLFRSPFGVHSTPDLALLLHHRDQRVRQGAQVALADRGSDSLGPLSALASDASARTVARAHAIWAIGQIARRIPEASALLGPLLDDPDAEIRTQALRTLADLPTDAAGLARRFEFLTDPSPRVQLAATTALAHHGGPSSLGPLLALLSANNNTDLVLRHGASYALSKVADASEIAVAGSREPSAAARLGCVLALRLQESERVAGFLDDPDPAVAVEAARASYDLRTGLDRLAAILDSDIPADRAIEPLMRRAIEANVLLGADECAARLGEFAMRPKLDSQWRLLAIDRLDGWDKPLKREGVWGNWADLPARSPGAVAAVVGAHIEDILSAAAGDEAVVSRAFELQAHHGPRLSVDEMAMHIDDPSKPELYRRVLLDQTSEQAPAVAAELAASLIPPGPHAAGPLRWRAMEVLARERPEAAAGLLAASARKGPIPDRQQAVRILATLPGADARGAIEAMARDLRLGWLDREISLEVYEAARARPEGSPARALAEAAAVQGTRPPGYSTVLLASGGDATRGESIFRHHPSAECIRCHTVDGPGTDTAPSLVGVAARLSPEKMVESVVEPGAVVAPGFGQVSAMPVMTQFLSPRQVRDVVAYLQTLDGSVAGHAEHARVQAVSHGPGSQTTWPALRVIGLAVAAVVGAIVWIAVTRRA